MSTLQNDIVEQVESKINKLKENAVVLDANNTMSLGPWKIKIDNDSGNLVFESSVV